MQQIPVFVGCFLDASRPRKDGSCLIKMNIYQKPHKKPYRTIFYATKEEWEKLHAPKLRDEYLKDLQKEIATLKKSAENIIKTIVSFSFVAFEEIFFHQDSESAIKEGQKSLQTPTSNLLIDWFKYAISSFEANDQIGTDSTYRTTMNSINGYKNNLLLHDITQQFLLSYEKHLKSEDKSFTTISIYMRNLRAIINDGIDAKILSKDNYPFEKYEIPSGSNVKKALKNNDIENCFPSSQANPSNKELWTFGYSLTCVMG